MTRKGYTCAWRSSLDDWKWPKYWAIWQYIIWKAAWEDGESLKRGEAIFTQRELADATGLSRDAVRWFLERCFEEKSLVKITPKVTTSLLPHVSYRPATHVSVQNYDKFNPFTLPNTTPVTPRVTPIDTPLLKKRKNKKKTKNKNKSPRSKERASSEHSRIFDFFVKERRKAINLDTWNPTNGGAMGKNIKQLLKQYSEEDIITMIKNYFEDDKQADRQWPWTFFYSDPVQWLRTNSLNWLQEWGQKNDS